MFWRGGALCGAEGHSQEQWHAMAAREPPFRVQRLEEELMILRALADDPDRVCRAMAAVAKRMKADGRYTDAEIETGMAELRRELGMPAAPQLQRKGARH
jgi:hypothetical protein